MSIENIPLAQSDSEAIERFPSNPNNDIAVSITRGFERLEEIITATESRLCSRISELEDRLARKHDESIKVLTTTTNTPCKEFITHDEGSDDAWLCLCGNTPVSSGFYPCDANGNDMVPTKDSNWNGLYRCDSCGRIIQQGSLEVVGRNPHPKLTD